MSATADDVVFCHDRAFRPDAALTFILETRTPESLVPFGLIWVGITHRGAREAAGRDRDRFPDRAAAGDPRPR